MTLLEVLVALAVFAIAALALIQTVSETAAGVNHLEDKSYAHWVAQNQLALTQLAEQFPSTGTERGEAQMGDRTWYWSRIVKETANKDLRRVEIEVRESAEAASPIETLVGFVGRAGRGG
ncbi:MAG: type II secretion system minor pseudopilin GspI [Gammaproteobacteria bacterium]|nr:type II secretion system minor pseudopilin GspI [Gammaproteobacteria bacterium]